MKRPNLRTCIIPEPGYRAFDSDLAQADAQVVAWDAYDVPLMQFFKAARTDHTLDLHKSNAADIFGVRRVSVTKEQRQLAKRGVHATNYGAKPPKLAKALGITIHEAERFQSRWFAAHPAIPEWHHKINSALNSTRTIRNAFGYTRTYFGRPENNFTEALAWIPQSTVALVADAGLLNLQPLYPTVKVKMQNHDSLMYFILRSAITNELLAWIHQALSITIPYPDPLVIPVGLSWSDRSWGDCEDHPWPEVDNVCFPSVPVLPRTSARDASAVY